MTSGNTWIQAGDGNDTVIGGSDEDRISGGDGDDNLLGNAGNDVLRSGAGHDNLQGGDDDDLYIIDGIGHKTILDTSGADELQLKELGGDDFWLAVQSGNTDVVFESYSGNSRATIQVDNADAAIETLPNLPELAKNSLTIGDFAKAEITDGPVNGQHHYYVVWEHQLATQSGSGDNLQYRVVSDPTHGVANVSTDGKLQYQPNGAFPGTDSFEVAVINSDGLGDVSTVLWTSPSSLSLLSDGGYMVFFWNANEPADANIPMRDTSGDVMAQRYDANDVAVDDAFVVNTTTNHAQRNAKVIELNDGFYVVWGQASWE